MLVKHSSFQTIICSIVLLFGTTVYFGGAYYVEGFLLYVYIYIYIYLIFSPLLYVERADRYIYIYIYIFLCFFPSLDNTHTPDKVSGKSRQI